MNSFASVPPSPAWISTIIVSKVLRVASTEFLLHWVDGLVVIRSHCNTPEKRINGSTGSRTLSRQLKRLLCHRYTLDPKFRTSGLFQTKIHTVLLLVYTNHRSGNRTTHSRDICPVLYQLSYTVELSVQHVIPLAGIASAEMGKCISIKH